MRGRTSVVFGLLALALAGCASNAGSAGGPPLGFARHDNAVSPPTVDGGYARAGAGIRHLLTVGQCAIGVGVYENGYREVGANWDGEGDCTTFSLPVNRPDSHGDRLPGQGGWDGSGLSANGAVALSDGSVIGVDSSVQRLAPDGTVTTLADLHLPWHKPSDETGGTGRANSVVQSGNRLVIGGGQTVGGHSGALMWTSTDGGHTLTPVDLPQADAYVGPMAASDNTVVAAESSSGGGEFVTWRSTDSGQSWQRHEVPDVQVNTSVGKVLRTDRGWLLVGSTQVQATQDRPFLASSPDGVTWTKIDTASLGLGWVTDATGGKDEDIVLVGRTTDNCGLVWTAAADGSWQRGELGCDDAPSAVTTLADGRVIAVGLKDVWVRA